MPFLPLQIAQTNAFFTNWAVRLHIVIYIGSS